MKWNEEVNVLLIASGCRTSLDTNGSRTAFYTMFDKS